MCRDLGTGFKVLQVLWLSRCSLSSVEGIGSFPELRELYLSFNDIKDLSPLNGCEKLEAIDLEGNLVEEVEEVAFLCNCPALTSLSLEGNPITKIGRYRSVVHSLIPTLELLDDTDAAEHDQDMDDLCGGAGDGRLHTPSCAANEAELLVVHEGIKYARCGIDDASFADAKEEAAERMRARPRTAMASSSLMHAASLAHVDRVEYRGASAMTPRARPHSAGLHRPSSARGSRPTSASSRPGSASAASRSFMRLGGSFNASVGRAGLGMGTGGQSSAALDRRRVEDLSDMDSSSDLTFGSAESFCGNPAMALRMRNAEAVRSGSAAADSDSFLEQLKVWKIEMAAMALQPEEDEADEIEPSASHTAERTVFDLTDGGHVRTPLRCTPPVLL